MSENIDWSIAPKGTTHWVKGTYCWEKWEGEAVYDWRGGYWALYALAKNCTRSERIPRPTTETKFEVNSVGGMKETSGKLRWTLLPTKAVREVVRVLEYGASKYSADNWKKVDKEKYKEALYRHWVAYLDGETYDPETNLHHLAHLICDGLFILWFDLTEKKDE